MAGLEGLDLADLVRRLALTLVPMILSLTVHECAHAFVATRLGDPTAKNAGRLTLNPQAHIDPWGTLLIPALGVILGGIAFIGWARPVPFRPDKFRSGVPRRLGSALVSAAGPLSNLALALLAAATMAALQRANALPSGALGLLLRATFTLNVGLALFNLLPFPPLDGHRLLPPFLDGLVRPLERYGFAILMVIFMFLPDVRDAIFYRPLLFVTGTLSGWFGLT